MIQNLPDDKQGRVRTGYAPSAQAASEILVQGENILVQADIHSAIFWRGGVVVFLSFLLALKVPILGAVFGFAGALALVAAVMTKHFLLLALTNKRVLSRYGVVQVDVVAMAFSKIESIELERMLLGQILGYATVVIMGTGNRMIRIPFVANATEFRREFDKITLEKEG